MTSSHQGAAGSMCVLAELPPQPTPRVPGTCSHPCTPCPCQDHGNPRCLPTAHPHHPPLQPCGVRVEKNPKSSPIKQISRAANYLSCPVFRSEKDSNGPEILPFPCNGTPLTPRGLGGTRRHTSSDPGGCRTPSQPPPTPPQVWGGLAPLLGVAPRQKNRTLIPQIQAGHAPDHVYS